MFPFAGTARLSQLIVALVGVAYAASGLALLFAPRWFFENVGDFPPFNRHYEGDLGAFLLPLGVGLLAAAARPAAHLVFIAVVAAGSVLHAANHAYDAARGDESVGELIVLVVFAALVVLALVASARDRRRLEDLGPSALRR